MHDALKSGFRFHLGTNLLRRHVGNRSNCCARTGYLLGARFGSKSVSICFGGNR
jgi:hypothetical protein